MKRLTPVLAAVTGLALAAGSGAAQCTGTPFTISPVTPGSIVFPVLNPSDFDAGGITYNGVLTVTITPPNNGRYSLCARADTPDMGLSNSGGYRKPIADILVKSTAAAGYVSLTQTDQPLVTNLKRTQTVTLNVQLRLSWVVDEPGSYASAIVLAAY